jgi:hypothetical protein
MKPARSKRYYGKTTKYSLEKTAKRDFTDTEIDIILII